MQKLIYKFKESFLYDILQKMNAKKTYQYLHIKDVKGDLQYRRIGNNKDGGYVMVDDFERVDGILSFGVGENITWEEEMAKKGIVIEMYDPTVDYVKITKENIFFINWGGWHEKGM